MHIYAAGMTNTHWSSHIGSSLIKYLYTDRLSYDMPVLHSADAVPCIG